MLVAARLVMGLRYPTVGMWPNVFTGIVNLDVLVYLRVDQRRVSGWVTLSAATVARGVPTGERVLRFLLKTRGVLRGRPSS